MRPLRITAEGFSAYRERVEVDFAGVDFFSISGPTGAGKSSLIDAMIFALYGRVPRLGGNAVAPVITAGADRARVAVNFEVEGVEYTAVRLAQRTATGGASVREARLQRGDQVLASGADDVTTSVEDLLKLRFDDFTRTVVLPQGDFARFLTATRSERQGLLRSLLGMDVYTRVRELAKTRAAVAEERASSGRRSLESLDLADDETTAAAIDRRDRLEALSESMPDREREQAELDAAAADSEKRRADMSTAIERLLSIEVPARLGALDELTAGARSGLVDAEEAYEEATGAVNKAEANMAMLPSVEQLDGWRRSRERLAGIEERLSGPEITESARALETASAALDQGLARLDQTRRDLDRARTDHAAHVLTTTLSVGEPCPVCAREVDSIPERASPPGLDELVVAEATQSRTVDTLRERAESARAEMARVEAGRVGLREQRDTLLAEMEGAPESDDLAEMEEELKRLTSVLGAARRELATREQERKLAQASLDDLADESRAVSRLLTSAQLKVADLDPPVSESDDVVVQWKELATWQTGTLERLRDDLAAIEELVDATREAAAVARSELVALLASHGVEATEPYAVGVATALHDARALVAAHERAVNDATLLNQRIEEASGEAAVATALANHLRANGFEQWLMAGALSDLVAGANELLGQLSGGGYSLNSDESGDFSIVDHRNADEMRSVSTLSGGETFLVSLALALSLAETLSAKGGSGLDAIILDEGFGTLDDESLDVVASVLEELCGRGLMVGVITHVKELATRAPVRYEVSREPGSAAVRRAS